MDGIMLMLPDYRVRQRDFLLEISRAITAQLDLGEVLRRVLNASTAMLAGHVGVIALRDVQGEFVIRAATGIASELLPKLNQQLLELVVYAREGVPVDHDLLNARLKAMSGILDQGIRQYIALPLVFADEALGLLIIFRRFQGSATADDVQVLQSFADQAAIAVHNAQLYQRIDQERQRLAATLLHSADGVMILDAKRHILMFNHALERMTGWRADEAITHHQDDVLAWKRLDMPDLGDALAAGWWSRPPRPDAPPDTLYVEGDLLRRDGLTQSVGITYAPLFNADGQLANIIASVRDITNFRRAQEMQNVFISTISHELKTPVAIIKGYAGTLSRQDADWNPDVIHQGLTVIEDEADRLTALIDNLLTASKIQAERGLTLNLGDARLDMLAERSVERFRPQTQAHTFVVNFPPDFPIAQGDEVRLRQVLDNLIGNAVKYSPDGGIIEVGGMSDSTQVTVYVKDQGVGLGERDAERIFERFYRVDGALSRKTQGTGLGLYLSKAIIDAHGGSLHVQSQPGQGSTFYFTLPLSS